MRGILRAAAALFVAAPIHAAAAQVDDVVDIELVLAVDVSWSITGHEVFNFAVSNLIGVLIGFAIAMLLMNTAAAIVGYFVYTLVLPIVVGIVGGLVEWFGDLAPWIELNTALVPLFTGDFDPTGEEWARIATAGTIWLVLPLGFGIYRLLRSEVK